MPEEEIEIIVTHSFGAMVWKCLSLRLSNDKAYISWNKGPDKRQNTLFRADFEATS